MKKNGVTVYVFRIISLILQLNDNIHFDKSMFKSIKNNANAFKQNRNKSA
jgi:hypothetical protein